MQQLSDHKFGPALMTKVQSRFDLVLVIRFDLLRKSLSLLSRLQPLSTSDHHPTPTVNLPLTQNDSQLPHIPAHTQNHWPEWLAIGYQSASVDQAGQQIVHDESGDGLVMVQRGTSRACSSFKSLSNRMLHCCNSTNRYEKLDNELERKLMEVKQRYTPGNSKIRSINSIILRFPQIRFGLEEIRGVFRQFDTDSDGNINRAELTKCLQKLQFNCTEHEIDDIYESCDLGGSKGVKFNEFIVVLCLIYILVGTSFSSPTATTMGSLELKATFDSIIEAFLYLDKNGDGKLDKKDMIKAMNNDFPKEKSPTHITMTRFKEMDWNKDGKVGFREFLFSLINWVGIECNNEVHITHI